MKTIIKNTQIVLRDEVLHGHLEITDEHITGLYPELPEKRFDTTIDGKGLTVMPGIIDDQVHFREPGLTHKADIESESKAAAAGGVTSFMEMPNTNPQTTNFEELDKKFESAAERSAVNYSFYFGATNDNSELIKKVNPQKVCGIKVFMGSSTGNMLVNDPVSLQRIFSESPVLVATHCEDEETIRNNTTSFRNKYGDNMPFKYHPLIRSEEACYKSSSLAVELAEKYNAKLHVLHLSTAKELELFKAAPISDKNITCEVCVHHLNFNDKDYDKYGSRIKWNPAVKTVKDQKGLLEGLLNNKIDVIATDHAPHTLEEKNNNYFNAPSGGPLVQHSLVAMLEFVREKKIDLTKLAYKMSTAPAELFQIEKRGEIKIGNYADLVIIDMDSPWKVSPENILYKCRWSPFEGKTFNSKVKYTIVNGLIVYKDGRKEIPTGHGKALTFNR